MLVFNADADKYEIPNLEAKVTSYSDKNDCSVATARHFVIKEELKDELTDALSCAHFSPSNAINRLCHILGFLIDNGKIV
jgi:hypothetical protein